MSRHKEASQAEAMLSACGTVADGWPGITAQSRAVERIILSCFSFLFDRRIVILRWHCCSFVARCWDKDEQDAAAMSEDGVQESHILLTAYAGGIFSFFFKR